MLIASAFPWAILGNLVRMLAIIIAAELDGPGAGNYVHEGGPLGILKLLPYVPAFAGLFLLGHWLREPELKRVALSEAQAARDKEPPDELLTQPMQTRGQLRPADPAEPLTFQPKCLLNPSSQPECRYGFKSLSFPCRRAPKYDDACCRCRPRERRRLAARLI